MEMDKYISADEMVNVCFVTSVNSDVGFCPHLQNLLLNLTAIFQAPELFTAGCATQLHLCNSEDMALTNTFLQSHLSFPIWLYVNNVNAFAFNITCIKIIDEGSCHLFSDCNLLFFLKLCKWWRS